MLCPTCGLEIDPVLGTCTRCAQRMRAARETTRRRRERRNRAADGMAVWALVVLILTALAGCSLLVMGVIGNHGRVEIEPVLVGLALLGGGLCWHAVFTWAAELLRAIGRLEDVAPSRQVAPPSEQKKMDFR